MRGKFDAIFLGDALVELDAQTRARLAAPLAQKLAPTGFLFAGPNRRMQSEHFESVSPMVYRRRDY